MVWSACFALAIVSLINLSPPLPEPVLSAERLVALVMIIWLMWGPRFGAAVLPAAWLLITAGWSIQDRLAPGLVQEDLLVRGAVCELPRTAGDSHRFLFDIETGPATPGLPRRVSLSWYGPSRSPKAGERWQLKVRLKRPRGLSNPGAFDFESWAYVRRIGGAGYVRTSPLNVQLDGPGGACRLGGLRQRIADRIVDVLDDALPGSPATAYLIALSVGARDRLNDTDWSLLRRTGTVHLMAISGLHIGLVAGLLFLLGRSLGHPFLGRWLALGGALLYAALAGFAVPTLRAFIMVCVVTALTTVRRSIAPWQILASAMLAVMAIEPAAPLSAGFWLSF
jgi:competence protein ComEC